MAAHLTLATSIIALAAWLVLGLIIPLGVAAVHALLAVAATAFVRWWGMTR